MSKKIKDKNFCFGKQRMDFLFGLEFLQEGKGWTLGKGQNLTYQAMVYQLADIFKLKYEPNKSMVEVNAKMYI